MSVEELLPRMFEAPVQTPVQHYLGTVAQVCKVNTQEVEATGSKVPNFFQAEEV